MLPQFEDLSSNISNLLTALSCPYGKELKIYFGNLSEAPFVLSTLCLLPIWDYCLVLKFPCSLIYGLFSSPVRLSGTVIYLGHKSIWSNLAQFWFSKSISKQLSFFFIEKWGYSTSTFTVIDFLKVCHFAIIQNL